MPFSPLPYRFARGFLNLPISCLAIRESSVQDHPQIRGKGVLYLTRKVDTARTGLTHVSNLRFLQTGSRWHRVTVIQNIMSDFLIDIGIDLHDTTEKSGFNTNITLFGNFPREFLVRIRSYKRSCQGLSTWRRVYRTIIIQ